MRAPMLRLALAVPLLGSTATGTAGVSGTIAANCSIASSTLSFGGYDPLIANASAPLNATGAVLVSCTRGSTGVTISLSNGSNPTHASGTTRAMSDGGTNYLSYELYSDSARTTVWNATNTVSYSPTSMAQSSLVVYGQVPAGQNAVVASYSDSVTATVNF